MTTDAWLRSPLFRSYLGNFVVLWGAAKAANAWIAGAVLDLPPFALRPAAEAGACAIELLALSWFIRHAGEDVLLGNLGWPLARALAPLVPVHAALSLAAALLA